MVLRWYCWYCGNVYILLLICALFCSWFSEVVWSVYCCERRHWKPHISCCCIPSLGVMTCIEAPIVLEFWALPWVWRADIALCNWRSNFQLQMKLIDFGDLKLLLLPSVYAVRLFRYDVCWFSSVSDFAGRVFCNTSPVNSLQFEFESGPTGCYSGLGALTANC